MNKSIKVTHMGEDYYTVEFNGKGVTVPLETGEMIKTFINLFFKIYG